MIKRGPDGSPFFSSLWRLFTTGMPAFLLRFLCFCSFLMATYSCLAQNPSEAKKKFESGNFEGALAEYIKLLQEKPTSIEYHRNIGYCYLQLHGDKTRAIPYLEKFRKEKKFRKFLHELGYAYELAGRYDDALSVYNSILEKPEKDQAQIANLHIDYCNRAKEAIQHPVNITFKNLGKRINTEFPDYLPFLRGDEGLLVFTSRRKGTTGNTIDFDGYYASDIYFAEGKDGYFGKAKNAGNKLNTPEDEEVVGITHDGRGLLIYSDLGGKNFGDLSTSEETKPRSYPEPKKLSAEINSPQLETSGAWSNDGSTLIFCSNREGGFGGLDLYMAKRLPDGTFAEPVNLGGVLNTDLDEDFPILTVDGQTLTFSSQGHSSIGGFDVFTTTWDTSRNAWSPPVNLGYPLNTSGDEVSIWLSQDRTHGYMSAWRPDGFGDLDIYQVLFNDLAPAPSFLIGCQVIAGDSTKPNVRASVYLVERSSADTIGLYTTRRNGKFVLYQPPGVYDVKIQCEGFEPFAQELYIGTDEEGELVDYQFFRLKPNNIKVNDTKSPSSSTPSEGKNKNATQQKKK